MAWVMLVATFIVASAGAYSSAMTRHGWSIWWYYVAGFLSVMTWGWVAKYSPWPLVISSMAWDISYNVAFLCTIALVSGEPITWKQIVGILFFLIGIALVGV